jgi:hypothetical protein
MAVNSKLGVSTPHVSGTQIGGEVVAISTTSQNIATHGATIPSGTTRILIIPTATTYWGNNKTVTSSTGYSHAAGEGFVLEHDQIASAEILADSGTPNVLVVYLGTPT